MMKQHEPPKTPREIARRFRQKIKSLIQKEGPFHSPSYWDERYRKGGNSGVGSYGRLALFKAKIINAFVKEHGTQSVIEFGCGDGAQLELATYPKYVGIDVSANAVALCRTRFSADQSKQFFELASPQAQQARAELAMSLDVIYHLVEDEIYDAYMRRLTAAAERFICIYSSNVEKPGHVPHIRHHCFTDWFAANAPSWRLIAKVPNEYPEDPRNPEETSWADFYFFASANAQS